MAQKPAQRNYAAENAQARAAIMAQAFKQKQEIFQQSFTSSPGARITVPLRNTGLVQKLLVRVEAQISGGVSDVQTLQALGASNFFSEVEFIDFSNKTRIKTTGWHLNAIASAKRGRPFGAAYTSDLSATLGYGNNYTKVQNAPSSVNAAASGTNNFFAMFEIPIARNPEAGDWRGIIDANVTNAEARLELTVNPNMFLATAASGTDVVKSLYKSGSSTLGTLDAFTITVVQVGLDQVPMVNGRSIIPILDASVAYMLYNTDETGLAANSERQIPFANNRTFTSVFALYNNNGTLNAGTDIDNFALKSANYTEFMKLDPYFIALENRQRFGGDLVEGMYYIDLNENPIRTSQQGNVTLNITPSAVTSGAIMSLGWECFGDLINVNQAGSIGV